MKQPEVETSKPVVWPNFTDMLLAGTMMPHRPDETPGNVITASSPDSQAQSAEDDYWDNVPI